MEAKKRILRAAVREARRAVAPADRTAASLAAARRALELPELEGVRAVLVYAALPEEIDPSPLAGALHAAGVRTAYPRVDAPGALVLHWSDGSDLQPGTMRIPEPPATSSIAAPDEFDAVIVPGAAFDATCRRLGMGGGFYDRLLPSLHSRAVTIGLAFDEQMVDEVPAQAHDVCVDIVVTPTRTVRRPR